MGQYPPGEGGRRRTLFFYPVVGGEDRRHRCVTSRESLNGGAARCSQATMARSSADKRTAGVIWRAEMAGKTNRRIIHVHEDLPYKAQRGMVLAEIEVFGENARVISSGNMEREGP